MAENKCLLALAGQPNCGKSTVFNALTGARQHVANYPGVTVDKMMGWYRHGNTAMEVVDLPGTYSLTSYSPEERVTRDFILHEHPDVLVNVMDASNIQRCLYLSFQLMEMGIPMVLNLNMMDVAQVHEITIDDQALSNALGIPVIPSAMKLGRGKKTLKTAIHGLLSKSTGAAPGEGDGGSGRENASGFQVDYGPMENFIARACRLVEDHGSLAQAYPLRWLGIKLMEGDIMVMDWIRRTLSQGRGGNQGAEEVDPLILGGIRALADEFEEEQGMAPDLYIAQCRYQAAQKLCAVCVSRPRVPKTRLTDRIDALVCHKFAGPVAMVGILWLLYYLSIVQGYHLTHYTWPLLAKFRTLVEGVLPEPGFIDIPLIRAFFLWLVDSVNALLNYVPIFMILFGCIAFLEDSGYMPRMAFIMDRLFSRYGLHGQSTLPMVLGGIYVGGCAVPGVMSCKGIPDERSRLATILIIPMLNCLAKVPLYVLLINIYFAEHKGLAMFYISTISLLLVLPVAKLLTLTVLKDKETAPFVMEMPPYHLPTVQSVLGRALERVWMFIRKITTIVVALAVVIFVLLQFPGVGKESMEGYRNRQGEAIGAFQAKIAGTIYQEALAGENLMAAIHYQDRYKKRKMTTRGNRAAVDAHFKAENPVFFTLVRPGKDKIAKGASRALRTLVKKRKGLLREIKAERLNTSFLGRMGKALVPVTQWAGFNWRVNVSLLSAFAAKESAVATLGALYDQGDTNGSLENRMAQGEDGFTPLHALALMMFMVLYPPCLATSIAVKLQSGSAKWMLFAMAYPMVLGIGVSSLIFTGGRVLGLSGLGAMGAFYGLALLVTILTGFIDIKSNYLVTTEA